MRSHLIVVHSFTNYALRMTVIDGAVKLDDESSRRNRSQETKDLPRANEKNKREEARDERHQRIKPLIDANER